MGRECLTRGLDSELIDQPPLLLRQLGQVRTGRARLIRAAGHFIGHLADIDHVRLMSATALCSSAALAIWVFMSLITDTAW
jgi:hypothetical protein